MTQIIKDILAGQGALGQSFFDEISNKKFAIYGYGGGCQSFSAFILSRKNISPDLYIDQKFSDEGSTETMMSPDEFFKKFKDEKKEDFYILVTIGDREIFQTVKLRFENHGFYCVHSALDVYEYNLCYANEDTYQNIRSTYLADLKDISDAYLLLCDDLSREIFVKIIDGHFNRKPINFVNYSYEDQYIVDGIGLRSDSISILNCGAYDGDTLDKLASKYGSIDFAVALECDFHNFSRLISKDYPKIKKLILLPVGSGEKNEQVSFNAGNNMLSRISKITSEKTNLISLVKCDDVLRGLQFNKIIIDTEGNEAPSLRGMQTIISDQSPDIALAAYHYPTDIYRLLNLINAMNPNYSYYLRNHSPFAVDTVLYAVKK
jgi:FkbM family methyltransferase